MTDTPHAAVPGGPAAETQRLVAAARADVLRGHGVVAAEDRWRLARYQQERPMLGALPAPLERELVHLTCDLIRRIPDDTSAETLRMELDRLRAIWNPRLSQRTARLIGWWENPEIVRTRPDRNTAER